MDTTSQIVTNELNLFPRKLILKQVLIIKKDISSVSLCGANM
jgi:hypothetical protein